MVPISDAFLTVLGGALLVGGLVCAEIAWRKSGRFHWQFHGRQGWESPAGRRYWAGSFIAACGLVLLLIAAYDPC